MPSRGLTKSDRNELRERERGGERRRVKGVCAVNMLL